MLSYGGTVAKEGRCAAKCTVFQRRWEIFQAIISQLSYLEFSRRLSLSGSDRIDLIIIDVRREDGGLRI